MRFRGLAMVLAVVSVMGACCAGATAQMGTSQSRPTPAGALTTPAKALDAMLSLYESEVVPAAKAMPADKYDFAPSASTFKDKSPATFDKVRTFGSQVAHIAQANYYFYSVVSGLKPDVDMGALGKLTKKEDCLKALEGSIAFGHKAIATITVENAFVTIKPVDNMDTRVTLAAFGVAHGYDHYGQMVEYLRMNGIVPPSSAK